MTNVILTISLLAVASVFVIYYILQYKPKRKSNIKELYSEGLDMLITGHRRGAYQNFKKIIEKDTNNIKSYLRLGQVVREGGSPQQALKIHRGLILRKNLTHYEKIELHKNMSLDYYKLKDVEHAIDEAKQILKLDKGNEWAMSKLINYYIENNNWSEAGEYLSKQLNYSQKSDTLKIALYKIQEGRMLANAGEYTQARDLYEKALSLDTDAAAAYYFIGRSYSQESEEAYQKAVKADEVSMSDDHSTDYHRHMDQAKQLLSKAIPMWLKYCDAKPQQAWMVIHLLKDALFVLDRYSEIENILKTILQADKNNIEVIASLADIHAQRGETSDAMELIDSALEQDKTSILVRLIKVKLQARKQSGSQDMIRDLDDIIHFLVNDKQFQKYKDSSKDSDILWLYESSGDTIPG